MRSDYREEASIGRQLGQFPGSFSTEHSNGPHSMQAVFSCAILLRACSINGFNTGDWSSGTLTQGLPGK